MSNDWAMGQGFPLFAVDSWWSPWIRDAGVLDREEAAYYAEGRDEPMAMGHGLDDREDTIIYTIVAWELPDEGPGYVWNPVSAEIGGIGSSPEGLDTRRTWFTDRVEAEEFALEQIGDRRKRAKAALNGGVE